MHLGVLADLELGEVEAEGLDLPDQLLQVPEGGTGGTGRDERLLDDAEVREQVVGEVVGEVSVAQARGLDALGDDEQDPAVRLVRGPLGDLVGDVLGEQALRLPQGLER